MGQPLSLDRCGRPGGLLDLRAVGRTPFLVELPLVLAARAPRLDRALKKVARAGGVVVLLDGTLVRTRRRTGVDNRKN
ncbi:hypothetical protein ACIBCU_24430 [Streptomyces sp. NPDC051064]|uniref:hypothetical protein n=1 Tax=Streptomyces sp. NPDC051064 TaxID=3365641 RepID=UPI003795F2CD